MSACPSSFRHKGRVFRNCSCKARLQALRRAAQADRQQKCMRRRAARTRSPQPREQKPRPKPARQGRPLARQTQKGFLAPGRQPRRRRRRPGGRPHRKGAPAEWPSSLCAPSKRRRVPGLRRAVSGPQEPPRSIPRPERHPRAAPSRTQTSTGAARPSSNGAALWAPQQPAGKATAH